MICIYNLLCLYLIYFVIVFQSKNINKNNEKSKTVVKPNSQYQNKPKNAQQLSLSSSSEPPKLIKDYKNNVGIVNLTAKDANIKGNSDCNTKHLTVQQTPSVNIKPDLVIQKVASFQIKLDNRKMLR